MTLSDHLKILELTSNNEVIFISFNSGSFSIQFFGFLKIGLGPGMFPHNPFFEFWHIENDKHSNILAIPLADTFYEPC